MTSTHRVALLAAADDLSAELKNLGLPLRFKRLATPERFQEMDGWWITIAYWKGPSVRGMLA